MHDMCPLALPSVNYVAIDVTEDVAIDVTLIIYNGNVLCGSFTGKNPECIGNIKEYLASIGSILV